MDANEDYLDSLLNAVMSQDSGGADGKLDGTQQNSGSEAELEEINDLLKKSDQNQMPDADMLAILEKAESSMPEGALDHDVPDVFDIFSSESVSAEAGTGIGTESSESAAVENVRSESADGSDGEAYLDALLNGTAEDDAVNADSLAAEDAAGEELLSLDNLQSEEELPPVDDTVGMDDLLSLDSLQSEEELPPVEEPAGEDDLLSLDSLQSEEELPPADDTAGMDDLLSLDSLQSEEEVPPVEENAGMEELLSLDSLQTDEELPLGDETAGMDDLLSLDSLQSDDLMSYGGLSEEGESGLSTAEDDEIQREIDELLGLTGAPKETSNTEEAGESVSAGADAEEEAAGSKKKKEKKAKKEKKKRFGKKAKEVSDPVSEAAGNAGSGETGAEDASGALSDDFMMQDADMSAPADEADAPASAGRKKKEKRKKEKAAKTEKGAVSENDQKEPGFFAKLFNSLFEETDDEEDDQPEMDVSDENREVIATVENEKIENKKAGSKKGKKGKKGKAAAGQSTDGDGDEEAPVDEKKAAKEKKKKEKKEKKEQKEKARREKAEEENAIPKKKLPRGKVFSIFAFCLTLLAVVVILCFVLPQQQDLKKARDAYYAQDYLTAYQNMEGRDLSDSDYILYMRSRMILSMQGKLENYLVYMGMDKEMAALNELMLAVHYYQSNRTLAEGYGALAEMDAVYGQILSVLEQQYGVDEQEAIRIFALDDLSYNEHLYYLVHGTEFIAPGVSPQGTPSGIGGGSDTFGIGDENSEISDVLPEEHEIAGDDPLQGAGSVDGTMPSSTGGWQENMGNGSVPETGGMTENGGSDDSGTDPQGQENGSDLSSQPTGGESQTQGGNVGNQGDGDVLYSGEVQNGNAVVQ